MIWFYSSMNAHVTLQGRWLGKTFITYFTLVWFLSCVNTHVMFQVRCMGKTFFTYFALILFFLIVDFARILNILCLVERPITVLFRFCQSFSSVALRTFGSLVRFATGLWISLVTVVRASSRTGLSEAIRIALTVFSSVSWNNSVKFEQNSNNRSYAESTKWLRISYFSKHFYITLQKKKKQKRNQTSI